MHTTSFDKFLKVQRPKRLSVREHICLLGELLVLYVIKLNFFGSKDWINSWRGPVRFPKDIVTSSFELEVKSIFGDEHKVKISNLEQLEVTNDLPLFLSVLMMEETMEGFSLP